MQHMCEQPSADANRVQAGKDQETHDEKNYTKIGLQIKNEYETMQNLIWNFFVSLSLEKGGLTIYNGPDNEKARWLNLVEFGK